ncbi:hypothetical protein F4825DRAFT_450762 [Nemania diffusa]|nr:hypothetical protein F4825DRAFT_450762 [Nemania diffusa]
MGPSLADLRRRSYFSPSQSAPLLDHQVHRRQHSTPLLQQTMRSPLMAPTAIVPIPSSPLEWKNAVNEVKRKYLARKYRSCSMQCCEILDNVTDTSAIEPLHLIYLHFYAASSFEWCARPLSSSSTYRTKLLCSAQTHYAEVESLIVTAEWNAAERARSPSPTSTRVPGSPGLSASSRTSEDSSTPSSPRTSVCSLDDEPPAQPTPRARVKPKKKVSFSGLPEFFEFQPEPYIRPDSPTLGWNDQAYHEMYASIPVSPKTTLLPPIIKPSLEERMGQSSITTITEVETEPLFKARNRPATPTAPEPSDKNISATSQEHDQERCSTPSNHVFDLESFLQTRTLNRFRSQLSALKDQVSRHRAAVDGLLGTSENTPIPVAPPEEPSILPGTTQPFHPASTHKHHQSVNIPLQHVPSRAAANPARPALRLRTDLKIDVSGSYNIPRGCSSAVTFRQAHNNTPTHGRTPSTPTGMTLPPLSAGVGGERDIRDRIERLRASGWQRKRFDSRRYEALREQVLVELACS